MYMKVVVASCASKTTGDNTTEPLMYCKECAKELGIGGFVCGSEEDEEEGIRKHGGHLRWEEEEEEQEWAVRLCTSEKMGWYNASDKTFDFEAMGNTIANFDGWQDIPETLGNVTKAIVECVPQEEGSMEVQAMLWTSCFLPRYFDSCGFKSNLTRLFFPGFGRNIMREMSKVARKFIGLGEEYLGFDDDEDDLDAEMVDAGLLAGSPEEEEGAGLLEEEEEEGDGETMTADSQEPQPMSAPMKQGEKADENSNEKSTENSEGEDTSTEVTSENTTTKPPST
ncbi:hypothetical protein Hamer_G008247 [Homarus americanus]|uniref:Uncharacterized protein n=1 Tax=Homarus americanus TaxID=6706 RepID=A0A8J5TUU0_HOMAM|nr:hypothetical protein Hamer_G008247 [Homarus americanus]